VAKDKIAKKGASIFGIRGVVARMLFSFFLVFATYNPTGRSFWHWVAEDTVAIGLKLNVGLVLLALYATLLLATWEVIGFAGIFLIAAICLSAAWQLGQLGYIDLADVTTFETVLLVTGAVVIGWGLSFSFIFARMTGIIHTRGSVH
jgi:hypothetical protein